MTARSTLLVLLLLSCKKPRAPPSANEIFEAELKRRGLAFSLREPPYVYEVQAKDLPVTVNLENVARNYDRSHDPLDVVHLVDRSLAVSNSMKPRPWEAVQPLLLWSLERFDNDLRETVHDRVTDKVSRLVVVADPEASSLSWVTPQMVAEWKVSEATVRQRASENLATLLAGKQASFEEVKGVKLGMIPLDGFEASLKASVVLAPNFRAYVEPVLGWPVYAVTPCRDFVYVIPFQNKAFLDQVGGVVTKEFRTSGYPLTTEVLLVSDAGIEAMGTFAE